MALRDVNIIYYNDIERFPIELHVCIQIIMIIRFIAFELRYSIRLVIELHIDLNGNRESCMRDRQPFLCAILSVAEKNESVLLDVWCDHNARQPLDPFVGTTSKRRKSKSKTKCNFVIKLKLLLLHETVMSLTKVFFVGVGFSSNAKREETQRHCARNLSQVFL